MPPAGVTLQPLLDVLGSVGLAALPAVGLAVAVACFKFFPFNQAIPFLVAPYAAFAFSHVLGLSTTVGAALGCTLGSAIGYWVYQGLFKPLSDDGSDSLTPTLGSFLALVAVINAVGWGFGDGTLVLSHQRYVLLEDGGRIPVVRVVAFIASASVALAVSVWLRRSGGALVFRAVADDLELSRHLRLPIDGTRRWVAAAASVCASVGGLLYGLDVDLTPTMASRPLLLSFAAVMLAAPGDVPGVLRGVVLIETVIEVSVHFGLAVWVESLGPLVIVAAIVFRGRRAPVGARPHGV